MAKKSAKKPKILEYSFVFEGSNVKKLTNLINYVLKNYDATYVETRDITASINIMSLSIKGVRRWQIVFHLPENQLNMDKCSYCNFPIDDKVLIAKGSYLQCWSCTKNIKPKI